MHAMTVEKKHTITNNNYTVNNWSETVLISIYKNKLCAWRHVPSPLLPRVRPSASRRLNVAVVSHAQYVLTVTAAPA